MRHLLRLATVVALLLLAGATAHADALDDFYALRNPVNDALGAAIVHLQNLEQADAVPDFDAAITANDALLAHVESQDFIDLAGAKAARKIRGKAKKLGRFLKKARNLAAKDKAVSHKSLGQARKANKQGKKATDLASKVPSDRVVVVEQDAKSAGFHDAGAVVPFQVLVPDSCVEAPVVTVANAYGANAVIPGTIQPSPDGSYQIPMTSEGWGAGRVTVTACGKTDTWLVYNGGIKSRAGTAGQILDGSWGGGWNVTRPDECAGISGGWTANIAVNNKGRIAGTWDAGMASGSISGRISPGGLATWTGGGGGVTFQGSVQGTSISGNFTGPPCAEGPFNFGRTRGPFSGGKN